MVCIDEIDDGNTVTENVGTTKLKENVHSYTYIAATIHSYLPVKFSINRPRAVSLSKR